MALMIGWTKNHNNAVVRDLKGKIWQTKQEQGLTKIKGEQNKGKTKGRNL
jgi:hypothetical protein